jgi:membrane protein DedA with SNARE-associated domain
MAENLSELLARYGYVLLATFLFIEAVGIPIPGETALVTAAALAGQGQLSVVGVFTSACIGTISGCMAGYWIGARGGRSIVDRFGATLRIDAAKMEKAHGFFVKHGRRALIVGRFVPVVRSLLGLFAGISDMPRRDFLIYNAIGGVIWAATFSGLGFIFGKSLKGVMHQLGRAALVLALVVGLVISVYWLWKWYGANKAKVVALIDRRWDRILASPGMVRMEQRHPKMWRFITRRLAQLEYLVVHLTIGGAVSAGVLVGFALITEDVIEGAPLTAVDQAVASRLHADVPLDLQRALRWVAIAGTPGVMAAVAFMVALLLFMRRRWIPLAASVVAYVGSIGLDVTLRSIVHRSEMTFAAALARDDLTSGLPTGHTIGAIVGFGFLAYVLRQRTRVVVLRGVIISAAVAIIAAIVAGRLVLGLGYLSTEAAAVACGVLWLVTCISGAELAAQQRRRPLVTGNAVGKEASVDRQQ